MLFPLVCNGCFLLNGEKVDPLRKWGINLQSSSMYSSKITHYYLLLYCGSFILENKLFRAIYDLKDIWFLLQAYREPILRPSNGGGHITGYIRVISLALLFCYWL